MNNAEMLESARAIIEKAKRATHIAQSDAGDFYRPAFTSGDDNAIKIIEGKLLDVPMSRIDFDFYCEKDAVAALLTAFIERTEALEKIMKTDVISQAPDFLWLQKWRNDTKQAAREALRPAREKESGG